MANISTLYTRFIEKTGRRDITTGARFWEYVNLATDYLDRLASHHKRSKVQVFQTVAGTNIIQMTRHRAVERVYIADTTDGRTELQFKTMDWILKNFADVPQAESSRSRPLYWTAPALTLAPDQDSTTKATLTAASNVDLESILFHPDYSAQDFHHDLYGILLFPVPDVAYTCQVVFDSFEATITADNQENYWSVNHEGLLMNALRRQLEIEDRNQSGRREFDQVISAEVQQVTIDLYFQEAAVPTDEAVMNG